MRKGVAKKNELTGESSDPHLLWCASMNPHFGSAAPTRVRRRLRSVQSRLYGGADIVSEWEGVGTWRGLVHRHRLLIEQVYPLAYGLIVAAVVLLSPSVQLPAFWLTAAPAVCALNLSVGLVIVVGLRESKVVGHLVRHGKIKYVYRYVLEALVAFYALGGVSLSRALTEGPERATPLLGFLVSWGFLATYRIARLGAAMMAKERLVG